LIIKEITGGYPKLRSVDGKKKTIVQESIVISNQILPLPFHCFGIVSRTLELILRLSPRHQGQQQKCQQANF
jgi:hypothetical protein